jgi:hypothetical protein
LTLSLEGLPGAELVRKGLDDLASGELTPEGLLVAIARPRLTRLGIVVPGKPIEDAELTLYRDLRAAHPQDAYSRYNSLLRRLTSFGRAAEQRAARRRSI